MTSPIDPIRRAAAAGRAQRSRDDAEHDAERLLPVVTDHPIDPPPPPPRGRTDGASAFAAHLLGQDGQKRGLRAPGTVETAKGAYAKTEWSGRIDRRARTGRMTKTEI